MRIAQIHFYYARNVVGYKHCRDIWILNRVSYINMQVADKKLWYDVICSVSYHIQARWLLVLLLEDGLIEKEQYAQVLFC